MIAINYRDPRPIYEQVKFGLRRLILTGVLSPNDKMPSVRELSGQLAINPNTVQRAYRELEAEGYIYSIPGKGSFVCGIPGSLRQEQTQLLDGAAYGMVSATGDRWSSYIPASQYQNYLQKQLQYHFQHQHWF